MPVLVEFTCLFEPQINVLTSLLVPPTMLEITASWRTRADVKTCLLILGGLCCSCSEWKEFSSFN